MRKLILLGLLVSYSNATSLKCELELNRAAKIAMAYATSGVGFKAMFMADRRAKKICGKEY